MGAPSGGLWVAGVMAIAATLTGVLAPDPECGPFAGNCGDRCCSEDGFCGEGDTHCELTAGCQSDHGRCTCSGGDCHSTSATHERPLQSYRHKWDSDHHHHGCFPGNAMVRTPHGIEKPISELHIGEEVAVWASSSQVEYGHVYAQGHHDAEAVATFVVMALKAMPNVSRTLQLTPDHFVMVVKEKSKAGYKRAKDVNVGDKMIVLDDELRASTFLVSDIQEQLMSGLYNPITTSGTIIVNGVVASCHSRWFLDKLIDKLGFSHLIPNAYQTILTPARFLYVYMEKHAYITLYHLMDSSMDIANSIKSLKAYLQLLLVSLEHLHGPTTNSI